MIIHSLYPLKSSTIYSFYPVMNTGLDSILDISKNSDGISRGLIQFDTNQITNFITNNSTVTNFSYYLQLYTSESYNINLGDILEIYPISNTWNNGNGMYLDVPTNKSGVSWWWKDFEDGTSWDNEGGDIITSNVINYEFKENTKQHLYVDITNIVNDWINGVYTNNGLLIKWENSIEESENINIRPTINFFSKNTNTIYPPKLIIKASTFDLRVILEYITDKNIIINTSKLPQIYNNKGVYKIYLFIRNLYSSIIFSNQYEEKPNLILPDESYYSIKDVITNEQIIEYDENYTKLNKDNYGNYFNLDLSNLQPERVYEIIFYYNLNNEKIIYQNNLTFKLTNG